MSELSHYLQPVRHRPRWVYAGALTLATLSTWAGYFAWVTSLSNSAALANWEAEQARQAATILHKPTRLQLEQKKHWEELALERDFNWDSVFQALQNANHPDIELLDFRPEKRQSVIILRGEARSVTALSEYLQKLTAQPAFTRVYLTRQDLRAHGQLETVGFEIRSTLVK